MISSRTGVGRARRPAGAPGFRRHDDARQIKGHHRRSWRCWTWAVTCAGRQQVRRAGCAVQQAATVRTKSSSAGGNHFTARSVYTKKAVYHNDLKTSLRPRRYHRRNLAFDGRHSHPISSGRAHRRKGLSMMPRRSCPGVRRSRRNCWPDRACSGIYPHYAIGARRGAEAGAGLPEGVQEASLYQREVRHQGQQAQPESDGHQVPPMEPGERQAAVAAVMDKAVAQA